MWEEGREEKVVVNRASRTLTYYLGTLMKSFAAGVLRVGFVVSRLRR